MKTLKELSTKELASLTPEEIERYWKVALMEEGLRIPEEPVLEPVPSMPELKTVPVLALCNGSDPIGILKNQEAADIFMALHVHPIDYDWENGSRYRYMREDAESNLRVQTVQIYDKQELDQKKKQIKESKSAVERNKAALASYEKERKLVDGIRSEIMEKISEASSKVYSSTRIVAVFQEYVGLSSGSFETAYNFLRKRYSLQEVFEATILDEGEWGKKLQYTHSRMNPVADATATGTSDDRK